MIHLTHQMGNIPYQIELNLRLKQYIILSF